MTGRNAALLVVSELKYQLRIRYACPDEAARMRRFAGESFRFITDSGEKLPAEVLLVEPRERIDRRSPFAGMINPYTRQRVPEAPDAERIVP